MNLPDVLPTAPARSVLRRDTLRYGLLGLAVFGGAGTLTACSSSDDPDGQSPKTTEDGGIELVSSDVQRAAGDPSVLPDVVAGLQSFTGGLYSRAAKREGNLVLSPYSVLVALGMTLAGAAGSTAEEMRTVLGAGRLGDRWHKGFNALITHIDGLAGEQERGDGSKATIAVDTADQIFGQRGVTWEADFIDRLAKEYGAALRAVDFETAAEQARTLINGWVEDQTNDKIVDLIPEGVLTALTRLVLVNAVYLKAPWEKPFEKAATAPADFSLADGTTVRVDMMRNSSLSSPVVTGEGWRSATLAYAGKGLAMTIVLPDGDLGPVEETLAASGPTPFLADGTPGLLAISLPKWTFRTGLDLGAALKAMGMPTAFTDDADFSAMTDDDLELSIADVLHQGYVAVDEEGTEAAAATAVVVGVTSAPMTEEFVVDRPFLFVIHDAEHRTPLFVGRVADPTA